MQQTIDVGQAARLYRDAGLSVIPIRFDGSKRPQGQWKAFQSRLPDDAELQQFRNGCGVAVIGGKVSGHLEILDFDCKTKYSEFIQLCADRGLRDWIDALPLVESPRGFHLYYRCEEPVEGSQELAVCRVSPDTPKAFEKNGVWWKCLVETRGEGGYAITYPTPPQCHPEKQPYQLVRGELTAIPIITAAQRSTLLDMARVLHEYDEHVAAASNGQKHDGGVLRPGDDYNQRGDYQVILEKHGWKLAGTHGDKGLWKRPGKSEPGISATSNYAGSGLFYVFSTNAHPFEARKAYSPFAVYTALEHNDDFRAAAKTLAAQGYGTADGADGRKGSRLETNTAAGFDFSTPAQWFNTKFPSLAETFGDAVLEEMDKDGAVMARDISEDFLAATLGADGTPTAPTVFLPSEERFYSYNSSEGIYLQQREPSLIARLSRLLLECARDCKGPACNTQSLEFRFRDAAHLGGALRKSRGLLEVPPEYFSTDLTEFIPCQNGMLRLSDRALLPFDHSYRRRNKLDAAFDSAAKAPLFLDRLMCPALEESDLDLLQRWCGLALIGENVAQVIMTLTGTAGGGKGTFIRVLNGIIGQENLASLRPHLLGERFELGRFLGKTLLYGADVPENFLNQRGASILKSLTGADPVTLEFKGSNERPCIVCRFNVIATCNSRLTVHLEGDTEAWRRRLTIIEYNQPKPEKVIANLDQRILEQEAAGVLNWMLDGLDKLRADGWQLQLTSAQRQRVDNLLLESDSQGVFARERLEKASGASLLMADCFEAYVEFCTQRGWTALTRNRFSHVIADEVVRQFGITTRHDVPDANGKSQRGWKNLALKMEKTV